MSLLRGFGPGTVNLLWETFFAFEMFCEVPPQLWHNVECILFAFPSSQSSPNSLLSGKKAPVRRFRLKLCSFTSPDVRSLRAPQFPFLGIFPMTRVFESFTQYGCTRLRLWFSVFLLAPTTWMFFADYSNLRQDPFFFRAGCDEP